MNKTYLAVTIGPIYKTMQMARKTREFWGASMLFSLLAKELCQSLKDEGVKDEDFLVPYPGILNQPVNNVGLYLDRIFCSCDEIVFTCFEDKIINPALKRLIAVLQKVNEHISASDLKSYFKINAIFKDISSENPLSEVSDYLNTMELFHNERSEDTISDKIKNFLENVNTEYDDNNSIQKNSFLENYFSLKDMNENVRIPSITEISTVELVAKDRSAYREILNKTIWKKTPEEKELFTLLKNKFPEEVKNYHKYFCILQADGDKLGATLMKSNKAEISAISEDLIAWGKETLKTLTDFGALPVYIGGDDLICFTPVSNKGKSILEIAALLNKRYSESPGLKNKSTLSIAVKIAFYKAPMYESYNDTFEMLKEAKKLAGGACCINMEKHSGQPHQLTYSFTDDYPAYIKPIEMHMDISNKEKSFLNSVMYTLRANEELIYLVSDNEERLWYFFENNFDEANKKRIDTVKYKYLKSISEYLFYLFKKFKSDRDTDSKQYIATIQLYSVLKIIRFIKGLDDDKD